MKDTYEVYLKMSGVFDWMDHLIRRCNMFYRTWKYWHASILHGKVMAVVIAYDLYLGCVKGKLDPWWKV